MSRVILILIVALVLLGFLSAVTMNMRADMERLRAENQKLSSDLNQLRADSRRDRVPGAKRVSHEQGSMGGKVVGEMPDGVAGGVDDPRPPG